MKIDKSILIVSIAAALVIFGASIALTFRYGYAVGLPSGLAAFFVLISAMLIANNRINKKRKLKNNDDQDKESEENKED